MKMGHYKKCIFPVFIMHPTPLEVSRWKIWMLGASPGGGRLSVLTVLVATTSTATTTVSTVATASGASAPYGCHLRVRDSRLGFVKRCGSPRHSGHLKSRDPLNVLGVVDLVS